MEKSLFDIYVTDIYWPKVRRGEPDECWEWIGSRDELGYGFFSLRAHRLMFLSTGGCLKHAQVVRHTCDNPPCVNPAHLMPGTFADNAADRSLRGRSADVRGAKNPTAKLTDDQVLSIRRAYAALPKGPGGFTSDGETRALGQLYGVRKETINGIVSRSSWRHLTQDMEDQS